MLAETGVKLSIFRGAFDFVMEVRLSVKQHPAHCIIKKQKSAIHLEMSNVVMFYTFWGI